MRPCKAFHDEHDNGDHFLIAYDYASGRKNRYTTLVWRVGKKAKIIGRELTLGESKTIVKNYPRRGPMLNLEDKTTEELLDLGLRRWDNSGLMLLPSHIYEQIPNGAKLTCIDGAVYVKGRDKIDNDTRAGLLAYGVFPTDKLTQIVKKIHAE
jgi:hypothetical protein